MARFAGARVDLRLTLMDSAQAFHWREFDGAFYAVLRGAPVKLWAEADGVAAAPSDADRAQALNHYLDLERDYGALVEQFSAFPVAREAIGRLPGLHVLNQDPWEALVAFILSANNNLARIRQLVLSLCEAYGDRYELDSHALYAFPAPDRLAAAPEADLRALGMGYRAPFLLRTARQVCSGFPLDELCRMDYEEAHRTLLQLSGVGDKVADCVLLFGCGHASAFPVDVWVERLMADWFGVREKGRLKVQRRAREMLGGAAGILQQYLFHCARTGALPVNRKAGGGAGLGV